MKSVLQLPTPTVIFMPCIKLGMMKDPVCNMMVDEKKARYTSEAGGRKVYLCSEACKNQFEKDPKKYGY
jgi:YHS domain-containing protein